MITVRVKTINNIEREFSIEIGEGGFYLDTSLAGRAWRNLAFCDAPKLRELAAAFNEAADELEKSR